jgi:hypothetical protein
VPTDALWTVARVKTLMLSELWKIIPFFCFSLFLSTTSSSNYKLEQKYEVGHPTNAAELADWERERRRLILFDEETWGVLIE